MGEKTQHEQRQEEAIRHLAEAVRALGGAVGGITGDKAIKTADHVLALVKVDETETDEG